MIVVKKQILLGTILLITPLAAAQSVQASPGSIGPGSPFYGLDKAWDSFGVSIGLKTASDVVEERAAEARQAANRGEWENARRAAESASSMSGRVRGNQTEGLQRAEQTLQGVLDEAPEEARQGLSTALENVRNARERSRRRNEVPTEPGTTPQNPNQDNGTEKPGNLSEARRLTEQGRQYLRDGNQEADTGDFGQAAENYRQARERFDSAIQKAQDVDSAEAETLVGDLRQARQTAEDARQDAQTQAETEVPTR